jgi:hypothetical protein
VWLDQVAQPNWPRYEGRQLTIQKDGKTRVVFSDFTSLLAKPLISGIKLEKLCRAHSIGYVIPDQHDTYASHASPRTLGVCFLRAIPVRGNLSWDADRVGQSHCFWEKGLPTQSTARRLTDLRVHTQFLSRANQWSSGESQTSINNRLLGLSDPYHRHAIDTFNTYSRGSTHRSLTDIGGGYNLGGAGLPYTTLRPSQPAISSFHLRAPPSFQFNQVLTNKSKCWV